MFNDFHRSMVEGDADAVIAALERVRDESNAEDESLLLLAHAYLLSGRAQDCLEIADMVLAADPNTAERIHALTLVLLAADDDARKQAALKLVECAEDDHLIADYLVYISARALFESDALDEAAGAFHHSSTISNDKGLKFVSTEALGDVLNALHDYPAAERAYLKALSLASSDADKARVICKRAEVLKRLNRRTEALNILATAINNYPQAPDATLALDLLREIDKTNVSRYRQGMVLYHHGEYKRAAEFFDYYLKYQKTGGTVSHARYFLARSLQKSGEYRRAYTAYRKFLESHPGHEYQHFAWLREGYCLEKAGRKTEAKNKYLSYTETHPGGTWADRCLWYAAELMRRNGELEEASSAYARLSTEYPTSDFALRAAVKSAISLSDAGRSEDALELLAKLAASPNVEVSSASNYWLAKLTGLDNPASREYLVRSWSAHPWGFYGRRALSRLELHDGPAVERDETDEGSFEHGLVDSVSTPKTDAWFETTLLSQNPSGESWKLLDARPHFARGVRLLDVGLYDHAESQFEKARSDFADEPELLYQFSCYMRDIGFHRISMLAAISLSSHVPGGRPKAPLDIRKLLNPVGYRSIIENAAASNNLPPELVFALIRQESFFDRKAVSRAGARGLSQIMPSTGRDLAKRLGVRDYGTAKLYDAETNISFGAYYFRQLLDHYGDELIALAAYNAGEVNADEWIERAKTTDSDFMIEEIGFDETYDYVKTVYVVADLYRHIWGDEDGSRASQRQD